MKRSKQVVNVQSIGIDLPPLKAKFGGGREAPNLLLTTSLEDSLAASPHRRLPSTKSAHAGAPRLVDRGRGRQLRRNSY